jgi:uncharacterized protein YndB with AHSA1/START domain
MRARADDADRILEITRVFDAPRETVWACWTDPELAKHWWGPHGFTVIAMEIDLRPGGKWRKGMRSPEGKAYWRYGEYRDVVAPERLVFTYFSDDPYAEPEREMLVTIDLIEQAGKTLMRFKQINFASTQDRDAHRGGWTQSIERLEAFVQPHDAG